MAQELLPIKVVFPSEGDLRKPDKTARPFESIRPVTADLRARLRGGVDTTTAELSASFKRWGQLPALAKVSLHEDARAKSYRPSEIFNPDTCPIIGSSGPGELLIAVTARSLQLVRDRLNGTTQRAVAHISTIENILPYRPEVEPGTGRHPLRVRLARHPSKAINAAIDVAFEQLVAESASAKAEVINYAPSLRIYRVEGLTESASAPLRHFPNVESITSFPTYSVVRSAAHVLRPMTDAVFAGPSAGIDYGVVGLIDSGTDRNNPLLQQWVTSRIDKWVPTSRQHNGHGSFVAGLITNGKLLNHGDARFPDCSSRIVDVVAFDQDGSVTEDELLLILDDAIKQHPEVRVWNLSLGLIGPSCIDSQMSEMAAALDERARQHRVLFVIAAGNMRAQPLRQWPLTTIATDDRIRPPADALRGLTVGGIAHVATASTIAPIECPSPFSRRGPGAGGLMKPELTHYAGNIDARGGYMQAGIISLDGSGNIAENVGTSFACPLVSTLAAGAHRELDVQEGGASPNLVKAMLIHSAFLKNSPVDVSTLNYRGLGTPPNLKEMLNCAQSAATVVMQVRVNTGRLFEKNPFPMPQSLTKTGQLQGEVFMTLLSDCEVERYYAHEYCRTNVTASLGTLSSTKQTKAGTPAYERQIHPALAGAGDALDDDILKNGFRWSPLKLYYRRFGRGAQLPWRLRIEAVNRAEYDDRSDIDVVLLLTIRSLSDGDQIYDEWIAQMNQLAWNIEDLPVRSRIRERGRSR